MTAKELAAILNGREYCNELTNEEKKLAAESGLVVVFGACDDCCEFVGAIDDEFDCYNGGTARINSEGLFHNLCGDENCPYAAKEKMKCHTIEICWNDTDDPTWSYKTDIPHETFNIYDEGELYCAGIVFELAAIKA